MLNKTALEYSSVRRTIRGVAAATTTGVDVTIDEVDPNCVVFWCSSGRASNDTIVLKNSTTVTVTSSVAGNVNFTVVEYGGVLSE